MTPEADVVRRGGCAGVEDAIPCLNSLAFAACTTTDSDGAFVGGGYERGSTVDSGEGRVVHVLGRFSVIPEARLATGAARTVAYLALVGGQAGRDEIAEALWPFAGRDQSRANLRKCVWQIPTGFVEGVNGSLCLRAETDITRAHAIAADAMCGERLEYGDVLLLSSDLLMGWYDEWIEPYRNDFLSLRVAALEMACRTLVDADRPLLAVRAGEAALAADPFRESAALVLVAAHLAQGNRHAAARLARDFADRLHEELGLTPAPQIAAAMRRASGSARA